jgi:hypothetical protein
MKNKKPDIEYLKNAQMMMPYLIYVESNVDHIPERLREIEPHYFVMFNPRQQKFEVHNTNQNHSTYCLTVPFDELDSRTLDEVRRTRIENGRKLMAEMEAHNLKLELDRLKAAKDKIAWKANEIYKYGKAHESIDRLDDGAYKTRWA